MAVISFFQRLINRILLLDQDDPLPSEYDEPEADASREPAFLREDRRREAEVADPTGTIHFVGRARRASGAMSLVLARPKNMEDATTVADRVKDRLPVIMNLEGVDESMARRIVDFVGGVVFALDGSLKKTGRAVYVCSPVDIPVEELRGMPQARRTNLFDTASDELQHVAYGTG